MNTSNLNDFSDSNREPIDVFGARSGLCKQAEEAHQAPMHTSATEGRLTQYAVNGNKFITAPSTVKTLPPGIYQPYILDSGSAMLESTIVRSDEWLQFKDSIIENVVTEIAMFWKQSEVFKSYGFLQRRGYLLYGPPGTGKTVLVKQIMDNIVHSGGIVIRCDSSPSVVSRCLKQINAIEPNRQIVCIYEDIDAMINRFGESELLALLDGEDSTDHILNIATTNYPEHLDRRIVGRPRRFDRIIKIGYPSESMRSFYFTSKLKITDDVELTKWVNATDNFTFAALTELVISVKCLGNPFEESVSKLKDLLNNKPKSSDCNTGHLGFK